MMEKDYKPDGWLGMIVGAKLWIDFCEKHKVTSALGKLVKELKDRGRQVQEQPVQGEDLQKGKIYFITIYIQNPLRETNVTYLRFFGLYTRRQELSRSAADSVSQSCAVAESKAGRN